MLGKKIIDEYITIFKIPANWTDDFLLISIFCAAIGLNLALILMIITLCNWNRWKTDKQLKKEVIFLCFFAFIWGSGWSIGVYGSSCTNNIGKELIDAYYSGNYEILEGPVQVLHQEPKGGHDSGDLIRINQREIEFSYFTSTPAYNQTISHGGVLKEGVYTKIYLYKGKILRIDLRKSENSNSFE